MLYALCMFCLQVTFISSSFREKVFVVSGPIQAYYGKTVPGHKDTGCWKDVQGESYELQGCGNLQWPRD